MIQNKVTKIGNGTDISWEKFCFRLVFDVLKSIQQYNQPYIKYILFFCVIIKFLLLRKQGFFSFFFSSLQNNSENLWNVVLSGKWQSGMKIINWCLVVYLNCQLDVISMQCSCEDHNKKLRMYLKRSWFSKFNPPSSLYEYTVP